MLRFIQMLFNVVTPLTPRADYGEVIYIQDPETEGFSAHYSRYPETFGQGQDQKEALKSLNRTLKAVLLLEAKEAAEDRVKGQDQKRRLLHA